MSLDVIRFQDDDEGYLAWIDANPRGFVVNCEPHPSPNNMVLHRASCMHITVPGENMEHWTHQYIKVCSPKNGLLMKWCRDVVGSEPTRCSTCSPLAGGSG